MIFGRTFWCKTVTVENAVKFLHASCVKGFYDPYAPHSNSLLLQDGAKTSLTQTCLQEK